VAGTQGSRSRAGDGWWPSGGLWALYHILGGSCTATLTTRASGARSSAGQWWTGLGWRVAGTTGGTMPVAGVSLQSGLWSARRGLQTQCRVVVRSAEHNVGRARSRVSGAAPVAGRDAEMCGAQGAVVASLGQAAGPQPAGQQPAQGCCQFAGRLVTGPGSQLRLSAGRRRAARAASGLSGAAAQLRRCCEFSFEAFDALHEERRAPEGRGGLRY